MYRKMMEQGIPMKDIDEMDIHWFFAVMESEEQAKVVPIDSVF